MAEQKTVSVYGDMPVSMTVGPSDRPACPHCQNSSQNAVPYGAPRLLRCASCKTIFRNHLLEHRLYLPMPTCGGLWARHDELYYVDVLGEEFHRIPAGWSIGGRPLRRPVQELPEGDWWYLDLKAPHTSVEHPGVRSLLMTLSRIGVDAEKTEDSIKLYARPVNEADA